MNTSGSTVDPIISVQALAAHLNDADYLIFDCRYDLTQPDAGHRAFAAAHIPGAQYVNLDADLSGVKTGGNGRHPLPAPEDFIATLRRWGVDAAKTIVVYDGAGAMFAARLWWMLKWVGLQRVAVLDGGWQHWLQGGHPRSATTGPRPATNFKAAPDASRLVLVDEVLRHVKTRSAAGRANFQLLDARSPARFRGEGETLDPVAGHIPGALNRFYQDNLNAQGLFKSAEALRDEFLALLGDNPPQAIVHQCGSGVTACHNVLAMEIAGLGGSRLYAGSWSEWCADPSRPVQTNEF